MHEMWRRSWNILQVYLGQDKIELSMLFLR
jgi:hypothetical protein